MEAVVGISACHVTPSLAGNLVNARDYAPSTAFDTCGSGDLVYHDEADVGIWNRKQRWKATHIAPQKTETHDTSSRQSAGLLSQPQKEKGQHPTRTMCSDRAWLLSSSETDSQAEANDLKQVLAFRNNPVTQSDVNSCRGLLVQTAGTDFSKLLRHLVGIETYPMTSSLTLAIQFLLDMFLTAVKVKQLSAADLQAAPCGSLVLPSGDRIVPVNERLLPAVFHTDTWKHLMIRLGFTLEETGTQSHIKFCNVHMPTAVKLSTLQGMVSLLKCLLVLTQDNIKSVMMIPSEQAHHLLKAISCVQSGQTDITPWISPLWGSYSDFCQALGFLKVKQGHHKHYVYEARPETHQQLLASQVALEAFHGIQDRVKETMV